jgi:glycerol-3-phosphate O-acyltransferase
MTQPVAVPLWLLILILAFAAVTFASHFLLPSVRWFFRRRMERAVARLNQRLQRPIAPFKLLERNDRILRLVYDRAVLDAVVAHAHATGVPESVAMQQARRYAREIVPGFSATLYFGVAVRLARWITRLFYTVRVEVPAGSGLRAIDPEATVVFVMNHRSNMDYVLVTWLVSERMTLSYAVGEWARVWPLAPLIRAMGAYFIRRNRFDALYRAVLCRYVQMATAEGVSQAIFPEGGLSLDGRVGAPKVGLLGDILDGYRANPVRDVVFVPVGLNYEQVLEDRVLTAAAAAGVRRFGARPQAILGFALRIGWRAITGRFAGFGTVAARFGAPQSLRAALQADPGLTARALGARLFDGVRAAIPILPGTLVAAALAPGAQPRATLEARAADLAGAARAAGVPVLLPGEGDWVGPALRRLADRGLVRLTADRVEPLADAAPILAFNAGPLLQALDPAAQAPGQ